MYREEVLIVAKPILFNTEMVQAILNGRKTVTRRVIKPKYCDSIFELYDGVLCETEPEILPINLDNGFTRHKVRQFIKCKPPCKIGDILYVRETFANTWTPDSEEIGFIYKADGTPNKFPYWGNAKQYKDDTWIPSIHMPKEAARIFLKVTDVRVEKLKDITQEQMIKEGAFIGCSDCYEHGGCYLPNVCNLVRKAFIKIWDSTIKIQDFGWEANPYVWVIEFEVIKSN